MKKESLITAITFIVLIAAFATGVYFIVQLVNGPDSLEDGPRSGIMSGELKTYTHPDYGFTFNYPASFKFGKFQEGAGEVILVQAETSPQPSPSQGEGAQAGFQIFVSLYEEKNALSKAIIEESAPDLQISNDKEIELGRDGIKALSFDSTGSAAGDTHEIWFVVEGNLYQVTSYKDFGGQMEEVIKSLRFN